MTYRWQRKFWRRPVRIFREGTRVGGLTYPSAFSSRATGRLDEKEFSFERKGFWKSAVFITDDEGQVSEVHLGTWGAGGSLAGLLRWSANLWNSQWQWTNNAREPVVTAASDNLIGTRGTLTIVDEATVVDPRMLALAGLYVNTYFVEAGALLIVIFLIWWA